MLLRVASLACLVALLACGSDKDVTSAGSLTSPPGTFSDGDGTVGMSSDTDPTGAPTSSTTDPSAASATDPSAPTASATNPTDPSDPTSPTNPTTMSSADTGGSDPDTGGSDPDTGGSDPVTGPDSSETGTPQDLSGLFLFSVSTVIQPDLPFQFLATVDAGALPALALDLQPLTLDVGKVTTPRQPFGEPLHYDTVVDPNFQFEIDFGTVDLAGPTNPITGSDVTADLQLFGTILSQDFVCGTVDGMVTAPLMSSVNGSTFAAVRVVDEFDLPTDVPINCAADTVTDP